MPATAFRSGQVLVDGRVVTWTPHPPPYVFQRRFLSCGAFEVLGGGAAGPGKTDCLIAKCGRAAQHPRAKILFLRTVGVDLGEVEERMAARYPAMGAVWQAQKRRWVFPSGGWIRLGYGATLKEVRRYLGHEYTGIAFDELGLLALESVWLELLARIRTPKLEGEETPPELWAWGTANPGGPGHGWLKRRFVDVCGRDGKRVSRFTIEVEGVTYTRTRAYVPGTLKDNPSLSPEYLANLRQMGERRRKQLEDGDWDAGEGLFFPDTGFRLVPPLTEFPDWWRYWASYDWGFRHPAAGFGFAQDSDGTVYVLESWHRRKLSDAEQARSFKKAIPEPCHRNVLAGADAFHVHKAHEESPETVADVFQREGVLLMPATTDREDGWKALLRLMVAESFDSEGHQKTLPPRLVWCDTPSNRATIERIRVLAVDPDNQQDVLKVDADPETGEGGDDDADALRYGCANIGGRKPRQQPTALRHQGEFTPGADDTDIASTISGIARPIRFRKESALAGDSGGQFPEGW